jgi:hypothetical protein
MDNASLETGISSDMPGYAMRLLKAGEDHVRIEQVLHLRVSCDIMTCSSSLSYLPCSPRSLRTSASVSDLNFCVSTKMRIGRFGVSEVEGRG